MMTLHEKCIIFEAILMPIHVPWTCFFMCFLGFSSWKIARDDSGLLYMDGDFARYLFSKKKRVFSVHEKTCKHKDRAFFVIFCGFLLKSWKSKKNSPRGTLQRLGIKIGGSGGGSKSRSRGVFGCASGVAVGEIALVVFYLHKFRGYAASRRPTFIEKRYFFRLCRP